MKSILLLTDFSEASHNALQFVCSFFSDTVVDIHLLCAYPTEPDGFHSRKHISRTAQAAFSDQLLALVTDLRRQQTTNWHSFRSTARPGSLLAVVQNELTMESYDYVVVGAKKTGTNELFGNSATTLVRQLRANVLVVPVNAKPRAIRNVVLAIDFASLKNCRLLCPVKDIVALKAALLTLLTIDTPDKNIISAEQESRIREFLAPIDPVVAHWTAPTAKEGIRAYLADRQVDFLITIPKHKGWTEVLTGSSGSRSLAFTPPVPLLALYDDGSSDRPRLLEDMSTMDHAL